MTKNKGPVRYRPDSIYPRLNIPKILGFRDILLILGTNKGSTWLTSITITDRPT
jgi:hypothetical protein